MKNSTPAVLLYYEDFLNGTAEMTDEEVGQYIRLLCYQNAKGHLSPEFLSRLFGDRPVKEYVLDKFNADENGCLFNIRMESEIQRRVKYSESRRANRASAPCDKDMNDISGTHEKDMSKTSGTHVEHMETGTGTETETVSITKENEEKDSGFSARLKAMRQQRDAVLERMTQ